MAESPKMRDWMKIEAARILGKSEVDTNQHNEDKSTLKTYNFRENRVKNHRTGKTSTNLKEILDGDLEL